MCRCFITAQKSNWLHATKYNHRNEYEYDSFDARARVWNVILWVWITIAFANAFTKNNRIHNAFYAESEIPLNRIYRKISIELWLTIEIVTRVFKDPLLNYYHSGFIPKKKAQFDPRRTKLKT